MALSLIICSCREHHQRRSGIAAAIAASGNNSFGGYELIRSFGRDKLPVWVLGSYLAGEGPDVGDLTHLLGVAFNHLAISIARHRDQLAHELHRNVSGAVLDLRLDD